MYKNLNLKNFLSWETLEFDFPEGVTLIEGFNYDDNSQEGSGKSAILNGLTWVLYGQIPKDVKVNQVIREGQKKAEGELVLESGHTIQRTRGKGTGTLKLFLPSGQEYIGKDVNATQKCIDAILGMSYETFLQSVYFAQNYGIKFITSDEKLRVQVLSDIADLSVFDKAVKETTALMKAEKEGKVELENELNSLKYKVEEKQSTLIRLKRYQEEAEAETKVKIAKASAEFDKKASILASLEQFLKENTTETTSEALATSETELQLAEDKIQDLIIILGSTDTIKAEIKGKEKEIRSLQALENRIESALRSLLEKERPTLEKRIPDMESLTERDIEKSSKEFNKLEAKLEQLKNPKEAKCPTCGSDLKAVEEGHFEAEIKEILEAQEENQASLEELLESRTLKIEGFKKELKELDQKEQVLTNELKGIKEELQEACIQLELIELPNLSEAESDLKVNKSLKAQYRSDIVQIRDLIKDIESSKKEATQIEGELTALAQELDDLDSQKNDTFAADILKTTKETSTLKAQVDSIQDIAKEKAEKLDELTKLREGFKDTKAYTFKALLRDLTNKANFYLGQLFDLPINIEFTNETEEGGVAKITDVVTIGEAQRPFALYSGGQARRIQLAVDLALSDIVAARGDKPMKLLIMDEVCKDLSEKSMEKVLELFEGLDKSVLMIEHNSIIKNVVNNTFSIELRNGVSRCL